MGNQCSTAILNQPFGSSVYPQFPSEYYIAPDDSGPFTVSINLPTQCETYAGNILFQQDSQVLSNITFTAGTFGTGSGVGVSFADSMGNPIARNSLTPGLQYTVRIQTPHDDDHYMDTDTLAGFVVTRDPPGPVPSTRAMPKKRQLPVCPPGQEPCMDALGYTCTDTMNQLDSCGGCPSLENPEAFDCGAVPNVLDVSCVAGSCFVSSCADGFAVGQDGKSCVAALD